MDDYENTLNNAATNIFALSKALEKGESVLRDLPISELLGNSEDYLNIAEQEVRNIVSEHEATSSISLIQFDMPIHENYSHLVPPYDSATMVVSNFKNFVTLEETSKNKHI